MTKEEVLREGLKFVANGGAEELLHGSPMWNIIAPTMGGEFFWVDLASYRRWRVQQNIIFGNCRVLDPNNWRWAWGGEDDIVTMFRMMINYVEALNENEKRIVGEKLKRALQTGNFEKGPAGIY
ncbi:MAG: hypothetical protein LBB80_10895 [Treponema sp.]|jgi:hypothetical protein|nr:hypothetical protein [Treponema sp.]